MIGVYAMIIWSTWWTSPPESRGSSGSASANALCSRHFSLSVHLDRRGASERQPTQSTAPSTWRPGWAPFAWGPTPRPLGGSLCRPDSRGPSNSSPLSPLEYAHQLNRMRAASWWGAAQGIGLLVSDFRGRRGSAPSSCPGTRRNPQGCFFPPRRAQRGQKSTLLPPPPVRATPHQGRPENQDHQSPSPFPEPSRGCDTFLERLDDADLREPAA